MSSVWTDCSSSTRRILGASLDISPVLTVESVGWSEVWSKKVDRAPAVPRRVPAGAAGGRRRGVLAGKPPAPGAAGPSGGCLVRRRGRLLQRGRNRAARAGQARWDPGRRSNGARRGGGVPPLRVPDHRRPLRRRRCAARERDRPAPGAVAPPDRRPRVTRRPLGARCDRQRVRHGRADRDCARARGPGGGQDDRARLGRRPRAGTPARGTSRTGLATRASWRRSWSCRTWARATRTGRCSWTGRTTPRAGASACGAPRPSRCATSLGPTAPRVRRRRRSSPARRSRWDSAHRAC